MKKNILVLLFTALSFLRTSDNKQDLICHTWKLIGIRDHKNAFKPAHTSEDEVLTFMGDGTYEKLLYGQMKIKGSWAFTQDSSKLLFTLSSMNGADMTSKTLAHPKPTDSIIKLTSDTLIIGSLAYYGPKQEYGHDDWYYINK